MNRSLKGNATVQRISCALLVAATVCSAPSALGASDEPQEQGVDEPTPELFGTFKGTYLSVGGSAAMGFAPNAAIVGGEVSLVRQTSEFYWFGVYADVVRDLGRDQTRLSLGPEFGWSAFGLDVGYVATLDTQRVISGLSVRPMITIGLVGLFARLSHQFSEPASTWVESGILLKYPFEL